MREQVPKQFLQKLIQRVWDKDIIKVLSSRRARGWREEDGPTVRIVVYIIIKNGG